MTFNADEFFAELAERAERKRGEPRDWPAEYRRKNEYLSRFAKPDPLTLAFNAWPGSGAADLRASLGQVCELRYRVAA